MKYSRCQDPKGTVPVSKTSSSMIQIPFEMEGARKNASSEEHSSILDADHSVFVEEPRKLTFVDPDDPDELISDVTSDPLVSEPSTSNNINFVSISIKYSVSLICYLKTYGR